MANEITSFPVLSPLSEASGSFSPSGTGGGVGNGFASQFTGDVFTSRGRFGNGANFWEISATEMKTANFVSGSAGCRIGYDGNVEFNDSTFRGTITALSGTFGSWTISGNSFATTNSNILIGTDAGMSLTIGTNNTFIGYQSGRNNTTGEYHVFLGYQAGYYTNPAQSYNTIIGYQAGYDSGGTQNLFLGFQAGYRCTGRWNVFLGSQTGYGHATNYYNTGDYNVFIGLASGTKNNTGGFNVFIGNEAGYNNLAQDNNVLIGFQSGYNNTQSDIVCIGYQSGYNNAGLYNVFIGKTSGRANTSGYSNSLYGYESGVSNTSAYHNSFFGYQSGYTNITGLRNSFFGSVAGKLNTANDNSFFGYASGSANSTATQNAFLGSLSGQVNTTGGTNSFFGHKSGSANTEGGSNCFYGALAGMGNTSGNSNVFIGVQSGSVNTIGGQNVLIGLYADCSVNHIDNSIGIGAAATITDDNQCVIGGESDGKVTNFYLGSGVTNPAPVATTVQATGGRGANIAGAALNIGGGKSTGSADGGAINFQISLAGGAGSGLNGLTTKMIIDKNAQSVRTTDSPTFAGCVLTENSRISKTQPEDDATTAIQLKIGEGSNGAGYGMWVGYYFKTATNYRGVINVLDNGSAAPLLLQPSGGTVTIANLAGVGTRNVVVDANGVLSAP